MPFALPLALLVSLSLHLLLLVGPGIDWSVDAKTKPMPSMLRAELRSAPLARMPVQDAKPVSIGRTAVAKPAPKQRPRSRSVKRSTPVLVLSVPASDASLPPVADSPLVDATPSADVDRVADSSAVPLAIPVSQPENAPSISETVAAAPRLPANGAIDYRVDRGDSEFMIGIARHQWEIDGDHYRLTSMVQSTGIVWLFKDFRVEMESRGVITVNGLRPDFFVLRRNDKPAWEKAFFDWQRMKVRVGNGADQDLDDGAQDFLSFNYQLGFLPGAGAGKLLPIATGRKYSHFPLESLGDEEIVIPAGRMRTLHLRAPGENTTELWLAYDYQLLPVKIRHVDSKGGSLVQVATHIQMSSP